MAQRVKYLCVVVFLGFIMCLMGLLRANSDGRSDVIVYDPNELTWGPVYRGLAMSIRPSQPQYAMGEDIQVKIYLKNLRSEEFFMMYNRYKRLYRMVCLTQGARRANRGTAQQRSVEMKPETSARTLHS